MLDRDMAVLYGVETRVLNQAVKRNIERFPERFCFQLNQKDIDSSKSQIVILDKKSGKGSNIKYMPYAFTSNSEAGDLISFSSLKNRFYLGLLIADSTASSVPLFFRTRSRVRCISSPTRPDSG